MSNFVNPKKSFPFFLLNIAFVCVLLGGIGIGICFDRYWLRSTDENTCDARLLGKWFDESDNTPLEFKTDGTFEYLKVTTIRLVADGKPDPNPTRTEDPVTGQYRWINTKTIELIEPDFPIWTPMRIIIEGDRMSLLHQNGSVRRYCREK